MTPQETEQALAAAREALDLAQRTCDAYGQDEFVETALFRQLRDALVPALALLTPTTAPAQARAATTHALERTSPKGEKFIGTCRLCGATGLLMGDARKPCPNPRGVTEDQAVLDAIGGGPSPADSPQDTGRVISNDGPFAGY